MRFYLTLCVACLLTHFFACGQDVIPRKKLQPDATTRGWLDIAPQKYDDLMPSYREVPDEKNAVPMVQKVAKVIRAREQMGEKWKKFTKTGEWDSGYWREVLAKNAEALRLVEQASRQPYLQIEKPVRIDTSVKGLTDLMHCMRLLAYQQQDDLQAGNISSAMRSVESAGRLSRLVMEADGALVGWLVGVACLSYTYEMVHHVLDDPKCRQADLERLTELLDAMSDIQARLMEAFRFEFLGMTNLFNDMYLGTMLPDDVMGMHREPNEFRRMGSLLLLKLFLQPNRSIKKSEQVTRYTFKLIVVPSWKRDKHKKRPIENWLGRGPEVKDYLSANAIGNLLLKMSVPVVVKQVEKMDQNLAKMRLLRVKIALREYHMKHGELPAKLSELKLPGDVSWLIDPYDGKQVRYSQKKRRLWSCGKDRKDAGGLAAKKSEWKFRDIENEPTSLLEFAQ